MSAAADQVERNLVDYVLTLEPAEAVRELSCLLSALVHLGEQIKGGADPMSAGSVLILIGGMAEGALQQLETKPGGLPAAPKDPSAMCATQLLAAQIQTLRAQG